MHLRTIVPGLLVIVTSCGGGALPGGTGGGATGVGGTGGGAVPECGGPRAPVMEVTVVGPDGVAVATSVSAAVTVASVDSCATVACQWSYPAGVLGSTGSSTTATRFILTAFGSLEQWTLYLRLPNLQSGLLAPGGEFDLIVDAGIDGGPYESVWQTVVLKRGALLMVFASNLMGGVGDPPLPLLDSHGIAITDGGVSCRIPDGLIACEREHAVRLTIAPLTPGLAVPGQTVQVGNVWFTNGVTTDASISVGGCHTKSGSLLGGFVWQRMTP